MRRGTFHTCIVQHALFQVAFYVFNMFQVLHIFLEASGGYWSKFTYLFRPCVWECMHTSGPMSCCSTLIYFPTCSWSFWSPLSSPGLYQTSTNSPWMLFWVVHVGLILFAAALWWANWFSRFGTETAKGQRGVASHNVNLMFRRMLCFSLRMGSMWQAEQPLHAASLTLFFSFHTLFFSLPPPLLSGCFTLVFKQLWMTLTLTCHLVQSLLIVYIYFC